MDIGGVNMFVKIVVLHKIKQCAFLTCMAPDQVDPFDPLNLSLAYALHRCII